MRAGPSRSSSKLIEHRFEDAQALAQWLAQAVADRLRAGITERGAASLVVSGGTSPLPFFQALRKQVLDWPRVFITLADERWVPASSTDSNERLVREQLLCEAAASARFIALKTDAATPEIGLAAVAAALHALPRPFDAVVLGMGEDGHTASLFPGMPGLSHALDSAKPAWLVAARAPLAPQARMSLTMTAILDARQVFLPIAGAAKLAVYREAKAGASPPRYPIAAVLNQTRAPVIVLLNGMA